MQEMGIQPATAITWFPKTPGLPYALIKVSANNSAGWRTGLATAFRRAYISDDTISKMTAARGRPSREILASVLPSAGPVMAGDFGEILVYLFQGSSHSPLNLYGQKKWRLKETRTHAAPYSDVVHFHLPNWPQPSTADTLLCSEVKVKSTPSNGDPIADARRDSKKDQVSRLAKTLVWLQERAMTDLEIDVNQVERFLNATEVPAYSKKFHAVAVVEEEFLDVELAKIVLPLDHDCDLVIISVPTLHTTYTAVYEACATSV
jgi:hypothetical protein